MISVVSHCWYSRHFQSLTNQASRLTASQSYRDHPEEDAAPWRDDDASELFLSNNTPKLNSPALHMALRGSETPVSDEARQDGAQIIGGSSSQSPSSHADVQTAGHTTTDCNSPLSSTTHRMVVLQPGDAACGGFSNSYAPPDRSVASPSGSSFSKEKDDVPNEQPCTGEGESPKAMSEPRSQNDSLFESDSSLTSEPDNMELDNELSVDGDSAIERASKRHSSFASEDDEIESEGERADEPQSNLATEKSHTGKRTPNSRNAGPFDKAERGSEGDGEELQENRRSTRKKARKSYVEHLTAESEDQVDEANDDMIFGNDEENPEDEPLPDEDALVLQQTAASIRGPLLASVDQRAIIGFPDLATRGHLSPSGNLEGLKYIDIFALISDPLDYKGDAQRYAHYSQYASHKSVLPQGLHPSFIVREYPNHLQGDIISWIGDLPWGEEYQSRDMLKILPEDARPFFRGQEQPHSYIQKRQTGSRLRILGRAYAAGLLDPNYRVPPTGKLFRDYGKNGLEGQRYIEKGRQWLEKPGRRERIDAIRNTPQNQITRWFVQPDLRTLPDRPRRSAPKSRPVRSSRGRTRKASPYSRGQIRPEPAVSAFHTVKGTSGPAHLTSRNAAPVSTERVTRSALRSQFNLHLSPGNTYNATTESLQPSRPSHLIPPPRPRASHRDRQTKPLGRQLPSLTASAFTPTPVFARQSSISTQQNVDFVLHRCRLRLTQLEEDVPETRERSIALEKRRPEPDELGNTSPGQLQTLAKDEMTRLIEVTKLGLARHRQLSISPPPNEDELTRLGRHQVAVRIDSWLSRYHARGSFWLGGAAAAFAAPRNGEDEDDPIERYIPTALNEQLGLLEHMVRAELDIAEDAELNEVKLIEIERMAVVRQLIMLRRWTEDVVQEVAKLLH